MGVVQDVVSRLRKAVAAESVPKAGEFESYRGLLSKIVEGATVDPEEAKLICEAVNRSIDADLERDAEVYRKRLEAADFLQRGTDATQRLTSVNAEIEAKERQMGEAMEKFRSALGALHSERRELEQAQIHRDSAVQTLRSSVIDPAISRRRQELAERSNELRHEADDHRERLRSLRGQLSFNQGRVEALKRDLAANDYAVQGLYALGMPTLAEMKASTSPLHQMLAQKQDHESEVARLESEIRSYEVRLRQCEAELGQIPGELARLDQESMKP